MLKINCLERNNDFESSSDSEEDEKVDDQITHITFAMLEDMYFKEEQNQEDKVGLLLIVF